MSAERILVTGATGFTGGHLCERLAKEGYTVRALVRDRNRCAELLHWGVEILLGDLRDLSSLMRAVQGIDIVYHIAALYRAANVSRRQIWETNVQGTKNMLDAAVHGGVKRFVHCSSIGVHGEVKNPPGNEETAYAPGDHYQESKAESEQLVLDYMAKGRLPTVIFRPAGIYGPRDLRFLKLIKAIKSRKFAMVGSGEVIYQMVYIEDLIDGILLCGTQEKALGNVYILAGEEATTLNRLVEVIAEVLDVPPPHLHFPVAPVYLAGLICELLCKPFGINPPLYRRRVNFFRKTRCFEISKAKRDLGFTPKTDLKTGLRRTVNWYLQHGYL
jgi:nucleoside-diphosphate-sugar epimerase